VLARCSQRFTMFLPDGTPVRARLAVSFSEYRNIELEAKEVKRETADYSNRHTVLQGETLSSIAGQAYGDPRLWRAIAAANRLQRARHLVPGTQLLLPHLPWRDPETGKVVA
jgi:nucleoid-associated protein YgaU